MTAVRAVYLRCDWPHCPRSFQTFTEVRPRARGQAAEEGWVEVESLDFCGPPADAADVAAFGPGNHAAAVADHRPVVAPAGHGRLFASCSCGAWSHPMSLSRDLVGLRWAEHIRVDVLGETPVGGEQP